MSVEEVGKKDERPEIIRIALGFSQLCGRYQKAIVDMNLVFGVVKELLEVNKDTDAAILTLRVGKQRYDKAMDEVGPILEDLTAAMTRLTTKRYGKPN